MIWIYSLMNFSALRSFVTLFNILHLLLTSLRSVLCKGPSTLATLFNHMWPRIVAGTFIPVGNHYFQALASTLQFVAQVCDRLWLVPATDRAFAYITYMSPPHVALVCSGPPQCAATCGWTKWPVCSGPKRLMGHYMATCMEVLWLYQESSLLHRTIEII